MKIIIAGGNGFLGKVLCQHFAETLPDCVTQAGNDVIILSRGTSGLRNGVRYENWDAKSMGSWTKVLENADVVINLVGRSVDCRYNEKNKKEILESRIDSTTVLGEAITGCQHPPKLWMNSASATIYRHSIDKEMTEESLEFGEGFSVGICKAWENAFFKFNREASREKTRQVALRITIVLGKTGGAVKPLLTLSKLFLGGKQAGGEQFFSWVHEEDFARMVEFIIDHEELSGPINMAAIKPSKNKDVMKAIRKAVHRPFGLPMPKWMLEFGARIIRTETELITKSRNVIPKKLTDAGFKHKYGDLESALKQIVN